jgi:glycosyltransferase involved in cell wall biosynthesis
MGKRRLRLLAVSQGAILPANQRLFRSLERRGHDISVVMPWHWVTGYDPRVLSPRRLEGFHGRMLPRPIFRPWTVPLHSYAPGLRRVIRTVQPDLLYIDAEPYSVACFQWAAAARSMRLPVVVYTAQNIAKRYPLAARLTERFVWSTAGGVICISQAAAEALESRGYRGEHWVSPKESVDETIFTPGPADPALIARYQLRPHVIAYVGRLVAPKGIRVLLEAYQRMPGRQRASLLLVGDGPLADECRLVDGVVVTGAVDGAAIPGLMNLASVVALPSLSTSKWREQFGRVLIEAMAVGRPIVGSDSGQIPRLINEAGAGLVVPEGDAGALSRALQELLDDPELRARLGAAGREGVLQRYTNDRAAERFEQIFLEQLGARSPDPVRSG